MADFINAIDKDGNILRTITINRSGLHHNFRDYLGPEIPEFEDRIPDYNSHFSRVLEDIDGDYIRGGGPMVRIEEVVEVDQVSLLKDGSNNIILISFSDPDIVSLHIEYGNYKKDIDVATNSPYGKKVVEIFITSENEINPISVFYLNDSQIIELKSKLNHGVYDLMSSAKFHSTMSKSYLDGNKYLNKVLGEAKDAVLDIEEYFNKRYSIDEIK